MEQAFEQRAKGTLRQLVLGNKQHAQAGSGLTIMPGREPGACRACFSDLARGGTQLPATGVMGSCSI